jgi:peptidoglycan/LPS O-acetylase OafA/YrhL
MLLNVIIGWGKGSAPRGYRLNPVNIWKREIAIASTIKAIFSTPRPTTAHYYSMDLLRGIAAIAVLFWHYHHFYFAHPDAVIPAEVFAAEPMYSWFRWLYTKGYYAVQLFWTISGFVFAAVYVGNAATTREFVAARFARLYPLHALTLAVVCVLELVSIYSTGDTKIYSNFNFYHLVLNLFFASAWGLERGESFDGPIWSVSIEILVYAIFWSTHKRLFRRGILGPVLASLALFIGLQLSLPGHIWACGFFFFAGAAIFVLHRALPSISQFAVAAAVFLAGAVLVRGGHHVHLAIFVGVLDLVMIVAALESSLGGAAKSVIWIGDNTYSIYLWHVPVQISLMLLINDTRIFNSPGFLIAYLCAMLLISRLSFLFFERPARRYFRDLLTITKDHRILSAGAAAGDAEGQAVDTTQ